MSAMADVLPFTESIRGVDVGRVPIGLPPYGHDLEGLGEGLQKFSERGVEGRHSAVKQNQQSASTVAPIPRQRVMVPMS